MSPQCSRIIVVRILRNQCEPVPLGVFPNLRVISLLHIEQLHLARSRKYLLQFFRQLEAEVLVKQQLHVVTVINRRSRSAAYSRQARMSSSVTSGKSSMISSCDMPAASQPRTSATAIRIPRMHGLPPRFPGSIVMIFW